MEDGSLLAAGGLDDMKGELVVRREREVGEVEGGCKEEEEEVVEGGCGVGVGCEEEGD